MTVAIPHILVVGLGNLPYPLTRHSIGQRIVDLLALRLGIHMSPDKIGISGQKVVTIGDTLVSLSLFKSKSLMNISGPSVATTLRKTVQSPTSLIVLADSLDHRPESLSVKQGGSPNGHNGIKSIISALGGELGFYRFRIGIGRDDGAPASYVMGKLSFHERQFWENQGLDLVLAGIENVARKSLS